jgi:hypothetical protein
MISFELPMCSPEEVNLWLAKAELVGRCWKKLEESSEIK